jgi:hypothetical protein
LAANWKDLSLLAKSRIVVGPPNFKDYAFCIGAGSLVGSRLAQLQAMQKASVASFAPFLDPCLSLMK